MRSVSKVAKLALFWAMSLTGWTATYTVSSIDDDGAGSLRQAMLDANSTTNADTIVFDIPGNGPHRITPLTLLPEIINPLSLDGYSQPGSSPATANTPATIGIEIDGSIISTNTGNQVTLDFGLGAGETGSVAGLAIIHGDFGLQFYGAGSNHVVRGCWFGVAADGSVAENNHSGLYLRDPGCQVGGAVPSDRNVFSGDYLYGLYVQTDAGNTRIENNLFGTDATGSFDNSPTNRSNSAYLLRVRSSRNTILGNVISGGRYGLYMDSTAAFENTLQDNTIGYDITRSYPIPQESYGLSLTGNGRNQIGGLNPGEANWILPRGSIGCYLHGSLMTNNVVEGNVFGLDASGQNLVDTNYTTIGSYGIYIASPENLVQNNTMGGVRYGIHITGVHGRDNVIRANAIGADLNGEPEPVRYYPLYLNLNSSNNVIGGSAPIDGNVFANALHHAILVRGSDNNHFEHNLIGLNRDGSPGGNLYDGIVLYSTSSGNTVIRNTITGGRSGIWVYNSNTVGNVFSENEIYGNNSYPIDLAEFSDTSTSLAGPTQNDPGDLDSGGNEGQNYPVLLAARINGGTLFVDGVFESTPLSTYTIELFGNLSPTELGGEDFLSSLSVTTDSSGKATFTQAVALRPVGSTITATATSPTDGTSEFGPTILVAEEANLRVTQSVSPNPAQEGDLVTLTVTLENLGPGLATDVILHQASQALELISANPSSGTWDSDLWHWTLAALPAGSSETLTLNLQASAFSGGQSYTNSSTVIGGLFGDPIPANNAAGTPWLVDCPNNAIQGRLFLDQDMDGIPTAPVYGASGIRVQAWNGAQLIGETTSTSEGFYRLTVPNGNTVTVAPRFDQTIWLPTGPVQQAATASSCAINFGVMAGRVDPGREPDGPSARTTPFTITEIHYNPADRVDGLNLEFVELHNAEPVPQELSGFSLQGEVDFTFPSGLILPPYAYIVVAADPGAFQLIYGNGMTVLGPWSGKLNNAGGEVRLHHKIESGCMLTVPYNDAVPWPLAADGEGHSLVLARPSLGEQSPLAWDTSRMLGGSPGAADPVITEPAIQLRINEARGGASPFIEVYNPSAASISLAGYSLADHNQSNRYAIASGTIAAGGYAAWNPGFVPQGPIFLRHADGRVLDAVDVAIAPASGSVGRRPDGIGEFTSLASASSAAPNARVRVGDVVINELYYHPISNDSDDEFIELYNRSNAAVDLSGWRFDDGIKFTFPLGSSIAPGGYLVVAADPNRLIQRYPGLSAGNTFGPWSGTLADSGERLLLVNNADEIRDELCWQDGGQWGEWADGGGSSLELRDANSDNRFANNWGDSDERGKANWTSHEITSSFDHGFLPPEEFNFIALSAGEYFIDDIEVLTASGSNLLHEGTSNLEGSNDWIFLGNHVQSTITDADAVSGSHSIHLKSTGNGDFFADRIECDLSTMPAEGDVVTIRFKTKWQRGYPVVLGWVFAAWMELYAECEVPEQLGTPGAANSIAGIDPGPAIWDVQHAPALPPLGSPVTVSALADDADDISQLELVYRMDPDSNLTRVAMSEISPGHYEGSLPAQTTNNTIAFHLEATDTQGHTSRFPNHATDAEGLVQWGVDPGVSCLGSYHLTITEQNYITWSNRSPLSDELIPGTLVYNGHRVFYDAYSRFRSNIGTRNSSGGDPLGARAINNVLKVGKDTPLLNTRRVNMQQQDTATYMKEYLGYWAAAQMGHQHAHMRHYSYFMNGIARGEIVMDELKPGDSEYMPAWYRNREGGSHHKLTTTFGIKDDHRSNYSPRIWATLEDFRASIDGSRKLSVHRFPWRKKASGGVLNNDHSDLYEFIDANNITDTNAYLAAMDAVLADGNWVEGLAYRHAVGDSDSYGWANNHNNEAYKPPGEGWDLLHYDLDSAFFGSTTEGFFDISATKDPWTERMYQTPVYRRQMLNYMHRIAHGPFANDAVTNTHEPLAALLRSKGINSQLSSIEQWIRSRRAYILGTLPSAVFDISDIDFSTTNNSATIRGSAPIDASTILINGAAYEVQWISDTEWELILPLIAGVNLFEATALDHDGQTIGGYADDIRITKSGPPPSPIGALVINEIDYHSLAPDADFVEIHNSSADLFDLSGWQIRGIQYTFPAGTLIQPGGFLVIAEDIDAFRLHHGMLPVLGSYTGSLDNGGETLRLLDASGSTVDSVRYDDTWPWPLEADGLGPSLQRIDAHQDARHPGNWGVDLVQFSTPAATNTISASLHTLADIWINEVAPTDPAGSWVELYTPTGPRTLNGYALSDGFNTIPLALSLSEWDIYGFAGLSSTTGTVALIDPQGTVLDAISYAYIDPSHSTGDIPDGDPLARQRMHQPTPSAANNPASIPAPVLFNEWMASNQGAVLDPADGDSDDWFELYHPGPGNADLSDYTLSDDLTRPDKFRIAPGTILNADSHLLLWADEETSQGPNHVNFQLSASLGETLSLYAPDGSLVTTLSFGPQVADRSEGRWQDGQPAPYYPLGLATPGSANRYVANNTPPSIFSIPNQSVDEGLALSVPISAFDPEAPPQTLVGELVAGPGTFSAVNSTWAWTPGETDGPGTYTVTVRFTDDGWDPKSSTRSFQVTVREVNRSPVLSAIPDAVVLEGNLLSFTASASDTDLPANPLTFSFVTGAPGMNLDANTGDFTWRPTETQGPAIHPVTIQVSDGLATAQRTFQIQVLEINQAPIIHAGPLTTCVEQVTALPALSAWRYRDSGIAPPSNWTDSSYDDSSWPNGNGKFGYGEGDEGTLISYGPDSNNRPMTTWFRTQFDVADRETINTLRFHAKRDDAIIIYLNGVEVARDNLPAGPITPTTPALSSVFGSAELIYYSYPASPSLLINGANTLAVEIHQITPNSNDLSFDLRVELEQTRPCGPPLPDQVGYPGIAWQLDLDALDTDVPSQMLFWSLLSAPSGLSINSSGTLNWANPISGTYPIHARIADSLGASDELWFALSIVGTPLIDSDLLRSGDVIAWPSQIGDSYTVQYCDDLLTGGWTDLHSMTANSSLSQVADPGAPPMRRRFYRVRRNP